MTKEVIALDDNDTLDLMLVLAAKKTIMYMIDPLLNMCIGENSRERRVRKRILLQVS